jgi:sulfatase maturation enzyme AslB (radical SAM superfamily)
MKSLVFFTSYQIDAMISLDGPPSIHNEMRVTPQGEGTHALVLENLQKLMMPKGSIRSVPVV